MTLRMLDPTESGVLSRTQRAPRPATLAGVRVALLTNGKPGGDRLLRAVGDRLATDHGVTVVRLVDKRDATRPAAPTILDALVEGSDAVITAIGD